MKPFRTGQQTEVETTVPKNARRRTRPTHSLVGLSISLCVFALALGWHPSLAQQHPRQPQAGENRSAGEHSSMDDGQDLGQFESEVSEGSAITASLEYSASVEYSAESQASDNLSCCHGYMVDWSHVPPVIRPAPRPGNFWVPPTGPAYYSLADAIADRWHESAPASGYPPFPLIPHSFSDTDWRFVDSILPEDRNVVERLKRVRLGECWLFATGGEQWLRFMNETNSRLRDTNNDYLLLRTRLWGDLWYSDVARVYGEYLWADSRGEELAPAVIDANRGDILNLFVDVNVLDWQGQPVFVRLGRQELLLGSQRLVSTLAWANTRRTFDGVRLFRRGDRWDFDAFWTQFVPPRAGDFDRADARRDFAGTWLTYRPQPGHFVDFYYLYANHHRNVTEQGLAVAPLEANTFGMRYAGDRNNWLWDVETALQFGHRDGRDLLAGMATAGYGYRFADWTFQPTLWVYYDWASGDGNPGTGASNTFNQLYAFGHYYLGWIDLVGRQNIHDLNTHLILFPNHWVLVWLQYHHFWLDQPRDALYNAGGVAIRRDPTGAAGSDVGDEMDIVCNFHVARYCDLMLGYSRLFGGGFLERTAGGGLAEDSEQFFLMVTQRW
jgi:hypothetical protein